MRKYDELQLKFEIEGWEDEDLTADGGPLTAQEARQISEAAFNGFRERIERIGERPGWIQDYVKLLEQGWPWRVACYMAWASSPKSERWPRTLQELATEVLGLASPRAIYVWRQKHATIDTVIAMLQAAPLWEHRRDVLDALVEMAKTPDYKAFNDRKLFLEMTGDYTPRSQLDLGKSAGGGLEEMSDEELRKWAGDQVMGQSGKQGEGDKGVGEDAA